jgi:nucleotide-binding universal stress UspA family protein
MNLRQCAVNLVITVEETNMKTKSILLALSGSEQSCQAARVANDLAQKFDAKLVAEHVIDIKRTWSTFGCDRAGLIGSGLYIATHELICKSLRDLATKLAEKFEAVFPSAECLIVEGDPAEELSRKASEFDMVVVGHRPTVTDAKSIDDESEYQYSLAEQLSRLCSKPLLVVQGEYKPWTKLKIVVSLDHLNFRFIDQALNLAKLLGVEPKLLCLTSGSHEGPAGQVIPDLRISHPELANLKIELVGVDDAVEEHFSTMTKLSNSAEIAASQEDLFVLPTEQIGNRRLSVLGIPTGGLLKGWTLPSVLFYPEEKLEIDSSDEQSEFMTDQIIIAAHSR